MHRTLPVLAGVALAAVVPAADALAAPYASRILREGSSGGDVRALQRYLDRSGHATDVDGQFGPGTASSVRDFEAEEGRRVNGVATRAEQRLARRVAAQGAAEPTDDYTEPSAEGRVGADGLAVPPADAPPEVAAIIDAGNKIAKKPYKYGGGHGKWRDSGYDCSGSMSYAFHGAGMLDTALDSTGFMSWGKSGKGTWVTTYANSGHSYMVVAGLRFDTSGLDADGSRWHTSRRSSAGYTIRHPNGL